MDPAVEAPVVVSQQRRTANTNNNINNTIKNTTTSRMSMKSPRGASSKQQHPHHFDRSMSENVNRYVRTTSGGGVSNVNTNLHDISSSSLSTTGGATTSVPSSSVHIDLYLVNIFKWRVRQDTFIKLVLIL